MLGYDRCMSDVSLGSLSQRLSDLFAADELAAGFALGRHILRYFPRYIAVYQRMGLAAQSVGLFADSLDLLQRAVSANPEDGEAWRALHLAATHLDLHPDADVARRYAADLDLARSPESDIARGHAAAANQRWADAYRYYRSGLEQHPERMDAALGLADALFRLGQPDAAAAIAHYVLQELPYALKAHLLILLTAPMLNPTDFNPRRHRLAVRGLDPLGELSRAWFPERDVSGFLPEHPSLPAWDERERWAYAR